jgi:hypothetical protein
MSNLAPSAQYPSFKFDHVGAKIKGTIVCPPEDRQAREYGTDKLATWPDGNPVMQTKIVLRTANGQDYAIYAKGRMARAITNAITAAGAPDLLVNGILEVEHHELGTPKAGASPPKLYRATYVPPGPDGDDSEPPF